ncbi:MAG TPA: hypothetical protein DEO89_11030 [Lachnospiraceae bacterium]|nr:hypothetical protein [Lachnospiraceae bacterium]
MQGYGNGGKYMSKFGLRKLGMGILVFGMAVCCYTAAPVKAAETDVLINNTTFPDATFMEDVGKFDKDEDGILSERERNAVTEITVNGRESGRTKITSLAGIEYFPKLTELDCRNNQLTELDVSKNTALQKLWFYGNQIESIDLSRNTELLDLDCGNNPLTSLDVSQNTKLTEMYCYNAAQLTALDVSNKPNLTTLQCFSNSLASLNISGDTALETLDCRQNNLTSLDIGDSSKLTDLSCSANGITELDLSRNTQLEKLYCANNSLTTLDVSNNLDITSLDCGSNKLTTLELKANTKLDYLNCVYNRLTSLDVSANTALQGLYTSNNSNLKSLDVSKNPDLINLVCKNNGLTSLDVSANTSLWMLQCSNNQLKSLDVSKNLCLSTLECDNNEIDGLDIRQNSDLSTMEFYNNPIKVLKVTDGYADRNLQASMYIYDTAEIDMGKISGWDAGSISNISGATLVDNVLIFDDLTEEEISSGKAIDRDITYTYDCGYNCTMDVYLYIRLNKYQINYELNGGTNAEANPTSYYPAAETIALEDPVKEDYTFDGWYKDAEFTSKMPEIPRGHVGNITLYAKWTEVPKPTPTPISTPTAVPTPTIAPTAAPTVTPTAVPTQQPTAAPTVTPTATPTPTPTAAPTVTPTAVPTATPTPTPTAVPTVTPTAVPTAVPTPTVAPTAAPTQLPTAAPTATPTAVPTTAPTQQPVVGPTQQPSAVPTQTPTAAPTKQPTATPVSTKTPAEGVKEEGTTLQDSKGSTYKVTNEDAEMPEVEYEEPAEDAKGKVKVPAFIKVDGVVYRVTAVSDKAFKKNNKVTKIIIGKNITKIGKKAFYKCKKLKLLVIKSRKLKAKNVAKSAFKGITKKTTVKVPKSKIKEYRKLLRKKGLSNKVKAIKRVYSTQEV